VSQDNTSWETGAAESDAMSNKLDELGKLVAATNRMKRVRSYIVTCGLVLILSFIALFLYHIVSFFGNYDLDTLNKELMKNAQVLRDCTETQDLLNNVKDHMIPKVRDEIVKKFEADLPKFKEEGSNLASSLQSYVEIDLNSRLIHELTEALTDVEKELMKNHPGFNAVRIEAVIKEAQKVFIEELTQRLEKRVDTITDHLVALNHSFVKLAESEEFTSYSPDNAEALEAKLVETMLELAIYHVNPDKGKEPAYPVGGGK